MLPVVLCVNGSHLAFKEVEYVTVEGLRFQNCRGPQQRDGKTTGAKFYSVYFDMCSHITMRDVELILTENSNSDGIGCYMPLTSVHLSNIYVLQMNGWGNAISMDFFCRKLTCITTTSITNVGILRQGYNSPQSVTPPSDYYGISILAYTGAHKLVVSNVAILDSGAYHSRAGGVSVTLLTEKTSITLKHIFVVSGWQWELDMAFKPISQTPLFCEENSTTTSKGDTGHNVVTISGGIQLKVDMGGFNYITVQNSLVSHCRIWPGFATTVPPKLWHWSYEHIANHTYRQLPNTLVTLPLRRVGLNITFAGDSLISQQNRVSIARSIFAHNSGKFGGGIYVFFSERTILNVVDIQQATVAFNWAESGGGVYIDYQDKSRRNKVTFQKGHIIGNQAMDYGAGMCLIFQEDATSNSAFIIQTNIAHNILHQSDIQDRMGGGLHIGIVTHVTDFTNVVTVLLAAFFHNQAIGATGGGLSVFHYGTEYNYIQKSDEFSLEVIGCVFSNNMAVFGHAIALEALPIHGKRFYNGIRFVATVMQYSSRDILQTQKNQWQQVLKKDVTKHLSIDEWHQQELDMLHKPLHRSFDPNEETQKISSGQGLIYMKAVTVQIREYFFVVCGGSCQGIVAVESEIGIDGSDFRVLDCVASHGGGVALLGESYIRIFDDVHMEFKNNYAFNRGGAIYANFVQLQANSFSCFLQYKEFPVLAKNWLDVNITFINNRATGEGNSIYLTDIRACLQSRLTISFNKYNIRNNTKGHIFTSSPPFCFIPAGCASTCEQLTQESKCSYHGEVVSRPSQALERNSSVTFIPGKQTTPLVESVVDDLGNVVSSVFTVQVTPENSLIKVNPLSKFTSDFRVILHGTPLNQTLHMTNNSDLHGKATLTLQSVDNTNLLIQVNIEMQCCPPGYVYTDEDNLGTCICANNGLPDILECKQDSFHAVLDKDHWAGYLQSDSTTQHTCNGLRFFTAPCPPGYCSPSVQPLPQNQSMELLEDLLCARNKRRGVLCGECMEGHSMPANLNGLNPVCTACDGALSKVGIIVWIVSEWLPMLTLLAFMLIFNVDLISGKLNSFLLFAQLLSFSNIRGEMEIGLWGYTWFVKLYRFLYGIWNLEFFGVFLPPYCFTPTASLSTLHMLLLNYAIGLFPLTVTIVLVVLDRSAEKWICCHPVDQCLRRLRKWKTKISNERSYDRALADFVILGFTRFMVTSAYILVRQTITAYDGTTEHRVWWQGTTHYGSADHIAVLIPAIIIVGMFVLLPSVLLLSLPLFPQVVGRAIFYSKIKCVKKFQFIPTFCSNVYTDRWVYHFVNVLQGCYKDRCRCFASFLLFYRIIQLSAVVFTPRAEDALFIQLLTALIFLLMIAACQPYKEQLLNTVDMVIISDYALILLLSMHKSRESTPLPYKQACSIIQLVLIYLPLIYLARLVIHKVWVKYPPKRCWKRIEPESSLNESLLIEDPRQRLGGLINITELRAGLPQDDVTATTTGTSPADSQYIPGEEDSTNM